MTHPVRFAAVALLLAASSDRASAQPNPKPPPEPLPMGVPYVYQPGNPNRYAPVVPWHTTSGSYRIDTSSGSYYTVYPATRPVVVVTPAGVVSTYEPTTPVVTGPSWALTPVSSGSSSAYPFGASGPVFGRYSWDYTGFGWNGAAWPHDPYSYQYPTISGRVWMGFGW